MSDSSTDTVSMAKPPSETTLTTEPVQKKQTFIRFDLIQRISHIVLLVSFTILAVTGLPQKFAESPLSQAMINGMGGIETTRLIHHVAAVILLVVSIAHILDLGYRIFVLRYQLSMLPVIEDFKHLFQDISYYLGQRKHRAYYGRYSYGEKVEYLAVVWGTVVMAITGFIMWNPIFATRLLPGSIIPASKAAHGWEAVLAVAAIIIWHFYHVHLRHFNKSIFNGKLSREEMEEEHPAELAQIEAGETTKPLPEPVLRHRQRLYYPVAGVLTVVLGISLFYFVTYEDTAITTVPPGEDVEVFVPITPTPRPTPTITPTLEPGAGVGADTWDGTYEALFRNRCGTCHGTTAVGGLSLATYEGALQGGNSGPGIVPGDAEASWIVKIQSAGGHPGMLTSEELNQVIEWINNGAPEQ
jgi:formate dehydrogenase gamma subunit